MPPTLVEFLVESAAIYAALGLVFALAFSWRGAAVVDPVAHGSTLGFRVLVVPGAALLWPLLAVRWWRAAMGGAQVPGERTEAWQGASERLRLRAWIAWIVLAPLIALSLVIALRAREGRPEESRDAARLPQPSAEPQPAARGATR
ncbi:MAG: hypothetical protein RL136_1421 [Planctomycetota bacterium]|jgi:hypothetical protein